MQSYRPLLLVALVLACVETAITMKSKANGMPEAGHHHGPTREYSFRHENVLGTSLEVRIRATSEESARAAEHGVLNEIDRQAKIYSGYDKTSELSRWMAGEMQDGRVSREFFELLARSQAWNEKTDGAFDIRNECMSHLWSTAAKAGQLPAEREIQSVLQKVASPAWQLNYQDKTAIRIGTAPITFNAIATGTIIDQACRVALADSQAVSGVLIDIGGDMKVVGEMSALIGVAPPRGDSETARPIARLQLKNQSVTTSGDMFRGFDIAGKHYSHIINPRTGKPVEHVVSSTVIAPSAEVADALATAFSVMTIDQSLALAATQPGVECMLISQDGQLVTSSGWAKNVAPAGGIASLLASTAISTMLQPVFAPMADEKSKLLPLEVQFEISQGDESRRYRRPYVAVWVEDTDGLTVRTLVLWLQARGTRWHPDLKRWYRDDQARRLLDDTNLIETFSRPTRAPGKYNVVWDGKDDAGQPVKPGTYTILIEAAREHGTYQLIRQELSLGDKPMEKSVTGNVEIKSAKLIYGSAAGK